MRFPVKLSKYTAKHFLINILVVLAVLAFLLFIFDLVETLRRSYSKDIAFGVILELSLLKLPFLINKVMPFIFIIGTMMSFAKLNRTGELIIMRSQGSSLLTILYPVMFVTILIGVINVTLLNPVSAIMLNRHEKIENKYWKDNPNFLAVSASGLWLKENDHEFGKMIINAANMRQDNLDLSNITFYVLDQENRFVKRYDAKEGVLLKGNWELKEVYEASPSLMPIFHEELKIPTKIVEEQLQDSFSAPETISFWELPNFISNLELAGFSASRHKLYFYNLLLSPLFLVTLILIVFPYTLVSLRQGNSLMMTVIGVVIGFTIYFCSDLIYALGAGGKIPILLASLAPIAITGSLGLILVLNKERG